MFGNSCSVFCPSVAPLIAPTRRSFFFPYPWPRAPLDRNPPRLSRTRREPLPPPLDSTTPFRRPPQCHEPPRATSIVGDARYPEIQLQATRLSSAADLTLVRQTDGRPILPPASFFVLRVLGTPANAACAPSTQVPLQRRPTGYRHLVHLHRRKPEALNRSPSRLWDLQPSPPARRPTADHRQLSLRCPPLRSPTGSWNSCGRRRPAIPATRVGTSPPAGARRTLSRIDLASAA